MVGIAARGWIGEVIRQAALRRIPRVIPVVWGPGWPGLGEIETLASVYRNAPVQVCWGANLYPATPDIPLDWFDNYTAYTTYRPLLLLDRLSGVPICVTEFARSTGGDPPVFAEYPAFVARLDGRLLWATAWYDAHPLGHWQLATLLGKLAALGTAITDGVVGRSPG